MTDEGGFSSDADSGTDARPDEKNSRVDRASRRRVLATAAGVVGLAGCAGSQMGDGNDVAGDGTTREDGTPTATETPEADGQPFPEGGAVAFLYDDGPMTDYTQAFPAHSAFDAPATSCIVSEWIGTTRSFGRAMDVERLQELAAEGWEIASHTKGHETLGSFELTADVDADDRRVYPAEIRHGHHPGKEVEITDGERTVTNTVAGLGRDEDDDRYVELEEPLGADFETGEGEIRHPEDLVRETLEDSRNELESLGFEVDTLLAPYDLFDDYSMRFASEYYDVVANGDHGARVNYPGDYDPRLTRRGYFVEFIDGEAVERALDEVAAVGGLGVLGAHTFKDEVTEGRIRETLEWIEERDIEVLTMREAARRFVRLNG